MLLWEQKPATSYVLECEHSCIWLYIDTQCKLCSFNSTCLRKWLLVSPLTMRKSALLCKKSYRMRGGNTWILSSDRESCWKKFILSKGRPKNWKETLPCLKQRYGIQQCYPQGMYFAAHTCTNLHVHKLALVHNIITAQNTHPGEPLGSVVLVQCSD